MQIFYRRADTVQIFSVLELTVRRMASFSALAQKNSVITVTPLRGAQLRVHQRAAYRIYHLRQHGQEKDDGNHGHDAIARSHVPSEGVGDLATQRHEVPVLPVDHVREGITELHGVRHGV